MPFDYVKDGDTYKYLVNGRWTKSSSGKTISVFDPSNGIVGKLQDVTKNEIDSLFQTAKKAQKEWYNLPLNERARILKIAAELIDKNKDILAKFVEREIGKANVLAVSEVTRTADLIRCTAEESLELRGEIIEGECLHGCEKNKRALVTRVPWGVVLAISPFNYPLNLSASKIAPALIAGNSVVVKPSTQGAISVIYMCELFLEAGLPPGVLNLVTGSAENIGDYLVEHNSVDMIAFTGSTNIGKRIAKLAGMKPLLMELGGKDAALILEDADIDLAVRECLTGAFSFSGQRCTAIKRIIIMESIANEFVKKFVNETRKLKVGSATENAFITPLINKKAADYIQDLINDATKNGAKKLLGEFRKENLFSPYVFDYANKKCRIYHEEQFGPVVPIIRVKTEEEGVNVVNESEYGLECCIFTNDVNKALKISEKLDVGTVQINGKSDRGPDNFPFTGVKNSGIGTQGIRYSIEAMTRIKNVVLNFK